MSDGLPDAADTASSGVVVAGVAATVSAVLSRVFTRGGRLVSVLVGYPFAVTALLLPPVVAAMFSPALAEVVLPGSYTVGQNQ
jgi:hypothetical protein